MIFKTVSYHLSDGVAVLTLNRPEVMNALTSQMRAEITEAVLLAGTSARVLVITGAGRGFCSGQDLTDTKANADIEQILRDEYEPMISALYNCPIPTISAVNGVAAGAGANLALAADVVIASEVASFIQAFTRIGLMPDAGGTYWLPRQIGMARAMGAMLFADAIPARQAADWGMIYEAVAADGFEALWRSRAAALARGPTLAYRATKAALRVSQSNTVGAQLALEARLQAGCAETEDFKEGLAAFAQKRAPEFRGK